MTAIQPTFILLITIFITSTLNLHSEDLISEHNSDNTSISQTEIDSCDDYSHIPRIKPENFMLGDNPRYTLTGELPFAETHIRPVRTAIFTGVVSGFFITQHIIQKNTIWSETGKFRIIEDADYALYSDKAGHFYGAYLSSYFYSEFFMCSGFSYDASILLGGLLGLAYSTYIEVMDGFAENWGFSPSDFYSDVAGVGFHLLQHYVPFFQNFTPKFVYFPANWHGERLRQPSTMFIDDYSSHAFFLSVNVHNLLPRNLKPYWPDWLQLSVGYTARNLCSPIEYGCNYDDINYYNPWLAGSPRMIIAFDYDLVKMLPDGHPFWNWFKQTLNYFKLPAPGIEIGNGTRFMLLYPFLKIN